MSIEYMPTGSVHMAWADGNYTFDMTRIGEIMELESICALSIMEIPTRILGKRAGIREIYHIIRLGLIGGGLPPVKAKELVDRYVNGRPLADPNDPSSPWKTAVAICQALMFGWSQDADESNEEPEGNELTAGRSALTRRSSSDKARSSGGRRSRSKK